MKHCVRLLAFFLCLWATTASATTYYVRTDGSDAHTGTTNTAGGAWLTIDHCADTVSAGDVCRVQTGTYVETASPGVSGTSGNTITLVADGVVTTCGMSFATKNYIRVIGLTFEPSTGGCSANPVIDTTGTNTGLEFWNVTIASNANGKGYRFDLNSGSGRCDKCIIVGGSITNIGGGSVADSALVLTGNDNFVGYVDFSTICYLGVNPAGSRNRFVNLNFSGFLQCGGSHPDFYYPQGLSTFGFSTNLIESNYGIGTTTSADNKWAHISIQNNGAADWNDNIIRQSVAYNMGSGVYSVYLNDAADSINRLHFYHNTLVNCDRANNFSNFDNCGNLSAQGGTALSVSIHNSIHYQAWANAATTNLPVWNESSGPSVTKNFNLAFDPDGSVTFATPWTSQVNPQSNVNPSFVNAATDFTLQSGSGARGVGGPLTTATSCSGTTLNVATNTGSFFIGNNSTNLAAYGGALAPGDFITVNSTNYQVSSVAASALTLSASITCSNGDSIYFGKSNTIDIGAYPYKSGGYALSATYTKVGSTVTTTPNDTSLTRFVVCYEDGIPITVDNTSPYTCTVGSGALVVRVYPAYASTTLYATATLSSDAPTIVTNGTLPNGTVSSAYSQTITGTCTNTPCTWTSDIANSGACTGVTFTHTNSTTATMGGTPTTAGLCSFNVTITDNNAQVASGPFTITVNALAVGGNVGSRMRIGIR